MRGWKKTLGALGVAAAAMVTAAPANAVTASSSPVVIRTDPTVGGQFYCGGAYSWEDGNTYQTCESVWTFGDGTVQVFVIGTDHHVWTYWGKNGNWSSWKDMGGLGYSYIWFTLKNGDISIHVIGADGWEWANDRNGGGWSGWYGPM